jgi:hypothetical protein
MIFSSRLVLANCDPCHFSELTSSHERIGKHFRRQFASALLAGRGVAIGAGMLLDVLNAPGEIKKSRSLIERCSELLATERPGQSLITIRGMAPNGRIDFANYLRGRLNADPEFLFTAYENKRFDQLQPSERGEVWERMEALSEVLNELGVCTEPMHEGAPGRLARHVGDYVSTLRSQNRFAVEASLESAAHKLHVSFDELLDLVKSSPSRSSAYVGLNSLVAAKLGDAFSANRDYSAAKRQADQLTVAIRKEFIDPGYYSIFAYPGEIILNGNFDAFDERVFDGISRMKSLYGRVREELLEFTKTDYPTLYEVMPELSTLLRRFALILTTCITPHRLPHVLTDLARTKAKFEGVKLLGTAAWSGFAFYYQYYAGVEQFFEPGGLVRDESRRIASNAILDVIETADNLTSVYEATREIFNIAKVAVSHDS